MPPWFDSHCHFDFPAFDVDRSRIWTHCQGLNLGGLIIPGVTRRQSQVAQSLVKGRPWFLAHGLHPYFMDQHCSDDLKWLSDAVEPDFSCPDSVNQSTPLLPVAVGEFGLHWTKMTSVDERTRQLELFEYQVSLARTSGLPVILHGVGAHDQIASGLRRHGCQTGGVVHAFSGSYQQAKVYLDAGLRLGIGATFFHANARKLRRTLKALPKDGVLIETDAPDMAAPFWNREAGIYSPLAIPLIAAGLAGIWEVELDELRYRLWKNLCDAFPAVASSRWFRDLD